MMYNTCRVVGREVVRMPKSEKQKLKLLQIAAYLYEKTDENHLVTTAELIAMLEREGFSAERKSVYSDIEALRSFGMDIQIVKGRNGGFALLTREFQLTELKLLVDAVQSSRFITQKKSFELIKKLENLVSVYERKDLERDVYIVNRIKNDNESIYYSTDMIHEAMRRDRQIAFLYFNYAPDKSKVYHNDKKPIRVSPFGLQFDSEKYYLIAYESTSGKIKHYRVDKMDSVEILRDPRDGKEHFRKFDVAAYSNATVKMFSGEVADVILECAAEFAGAVIDKFGKQCRFIPSGNGRYTVCIQAVPSPALFSWVFTFGGGIRIKSPETAVAAYKKQLEDALSGIGSG